MKLRINILVVLLLLSAVYVRSCRKAGSWLVKADETQHADALVILMGSIADRILHAVDLYRNGLVDKVILVETGMNSFRELKERGVDIVSSSEQIRNAAVDLGISADNIVLLPGNTQSTLQEAQVVKEYLSDIDGIDTFLLVTSAHHSRRAYMVFRSTFGASLNHIVISCSPSPYSDFNPDKWWKRKDDIETVLLEYLKLANFVLCEREY